MTTKARILTKPKPAARAKPLKSAKPKNSKLAGKGKSKSPPIGPVESAQVHMNPPTQAALDAIGRGVRGVPGWVNGAERPKKGPGSGKPNIHMKAKALGIDQAAPEADTALPTITIDPELLNTWMPGQAGSGRPCKLTPDLGSRICTLYARRHRLKTICELEGMPYVDTVYGWLTAGHEGVNGALYKAFQQSFARARELRAMTRVDVIEDIFDRLTVRKGNEGNMLDPQQASVAAKLQETMAAMENQSQFGKQLKLVGDKNKPIELRTRTGYTDAELEALARGESIDNVE